MKLIKSLVLGVAFAASLPTASHALTLDFEGVGSFASVNDFYNGGFDIPGSSSSAPATGVNYGVSFTGDALALQNDSLGPYFSNAPTPGTIMVAVGPDAVLNFNTGFVKSFSFHYSSTVDAFNVVQVFSGLNGTGQRLARVALQENNLDSGCTGTTYCNWQQISSSFNGVAKSISFSGNPAANGFVGFDNVTITPVPEPETYGLLLAGLGLIGTMVGRRNRG